MRLSRVQQQERTRAAVLKAARAEFGECGYNAAKVDRIADRAELTRGAVYSNFPSKRALYLAVLADLAGIPVRDGPASFPSSVTEAAGAFARVWLERLPWVGDAPALGQLRLGSLTGLADDERFRVSLAQVVRLEALLLGMALEQAPPQQERRVRLAEVLLTLLDGAGHMAESAPGFGDPFDLARACEHLAVIDLPDRWDPPHLPYVPPAQAGQAGWEPPGGLLDFLTGQPLDAGADGLVTVLGAGRLEAVEEAVRSVGHDEQATVAVVAGDPAETGRLVRARIGDLTGCLTRVFPARTWSPLRLALDDRARLASALGIGPVDDTTEVAVRIHDGAIVARAEGRGASHAAAGYQVDRPTRAPGRDM